VGSSDLKIEGYSFELDFPCGLSAQGTFGIWNLPVQRRDDTSCEIIQLCHARNGILIAYVRQMHNLAYINFVFLYLSTMSSE
jgi:hypothetical protein